MRLVTSRPVARRLDPQHRREHGDRCNGGKQHFNGFQDDTVNGVHQRVVRRTTRGINGDEHPCFSPANVSFVEPPISPEVGIYLFY